MRALITGVTGQDGAYLAQFLLAKGYEVHGLLRRSASADVVDERLRWLNIAGQVRMVDGNLTDLSSLIRTLQDLQPRRPVLCQGLLGATAADRQRDRDGRA